MQTLGYHGKMCLKYVIIENTVVLFTFQKLKLRDVTHVRVLMRGLGQGRMVS